MHEQATLERLRQRDPDALDQLTKQYNSYVCTVLSKVLQGVGTWSDVEELSNDVFLALWRSAASVEPGKLKAWLGVVARNKARSWLRTRRDLPMDLDEIELPDDSLPLEEEAQRRELARAVRKAIDGMRATDRQIFMRYYYDLQPAEVIAQELHMAPASIRSRLSRGRERLRKVLEQEVRP